MRLRILVAILSLLLPAVVIAQHEHHDHSHDSYGKVNFPTSCSPKAQEAFNQAVAIIHSFQYETAAEAFTHVAKTDPQCAMAYWGLAMTYYHPLWTPPTPSELEKGKAAMEKALSLEVKTEREKAYIAALSAFYRDSDKLDHRTRAVAYEKEMEKLATRFADDDEANIFYALALNGTALATDKTYANQKKAAEILNRLLPRAPEHPGIAHYVIHSYDYPALAQLALPAARAYAKIAPASAHALHMPSHIFTRLGLWDDSISSNLASAAAAKKLAAKLAPGKAAYEALHATDYLVYAYLQLGAEEKAKALVDEVAAIEAIDNETSSAAYALAAVPARYALERRKWEEAATLTVRPASFSWAKVPYAEAITWFARAVGAARSGKIEDAKLSREKLAAIQQALVEKKDAYWADQVKIQLLAAKAWIKHAKGKNEAAEKLMREAADLEDKTEKHPVTPGSIVPAREMLADLLIELNRPAEAIAEFEASLKVNPNRRAALAGVERAKKAAQTARATK